MTALLAADSVHVSVNNLELLMPTSLTVAAGDIVAVTGANGTGKTTLLRVLAGLTRATGGTVTYRGHPVDERRREFRAGVGALVGTPPIAPDLTVREHMVMVAASWGHSVTDARVRADRTLQDLQFHRFASRFPHELSSGQSQMFALGLTLCRDFTVLLLDEPEQRSMLSGCHWWDTFFGSGRETAQQ